AGPRRLEVRFAAGATTLSPAAAQVVTSLAKSVHRTPETSFEVEAHAPATGDDPSTARRLSLARTLAIRAALIEAGVPAASVYMRALGAPPPSEAADADRARITVMGLAPSPVPQQAKQP
ncbi:MAG: OmpA family protein, partial [Steroidobacteraceae bacterium]